MTESLSYNQQLYTTLFVHAVLLYLILREIRIQTILVQAVGWQWKRTGLQADRSSFLKREKSTDEYAVAGGAAVGDDRGSAVEDDVGAAVGGDRGAAVGQHVEDDGKEGEEPDFVGLRLDKIGNIRYYHFSSGATLVNLIRK